MFFTKLVAIEQLADLKNKSKLDFAFSKLVSIAKAVMNDQVEQVVNRGVVLTIFIC